MEENQRDLLPDLTDPATLCDVTRVAFVLLQKWALSPEQQLTLLGIEAADVPHLPRYRTGERPLPSASEALHRAGHLLAIHRSLRLLFPENEGLRFSWVRRRNRAFGGRAPIDIMIEEGRRGMVRVSALLDQHCTQ